jgi:hypothetical protein
MRVSCKIVCASILAQSAPEAKARRVPRRHEFMHESNAPARQRVGLARGLSLREVIFGVLTSAVLIPALFYLQFGEVGPIGFGFTVFIQVLLILIGVGSYFQDRTEYHTEVAPSGGFADRIGAFWLLACGLGPFFGWIATAMQPTTHSWRWQYGARIVLAGLLPIITALPLLRYARGRAALVALPMLLGVTALPLLSCFWTMRDFKQGPIVSQVEIVREAGGYLACKATDGTEPPPCDARRWSSMGTRLEVIWLKHSGRVLGIRRLDALRGS